VLHGIRLNRVEAALPLNRFKNNGGRPAGLNIGLEHLLDGALHLCQVGGLTRKRDVVNLRREGTKSGHVGLHLAGERYRKQAAAMEAAAKRRACQSALLAAIGVNAWEGVGAFMTWSC
jgi:hypothetical protein